MTNERCQPGESDEAIDSSKETSGVEAVGSTSWPMTPIAETTSSPSVTWADGPDTESGRVPTWRFPSASALALEDSQTKARDSGDVALALETDDEVDDEAWPEPSPFENVVTKATTEHAATPAGDGFLDASVGKPHGLDSPSRPSAGATDSASSAVSRAYVGVRRPGLTAEQRKASRKAHARKRREKATARAKARNEKAAARTPQTHSHGSKSGRGRKHARHGATDFYEREDASASPAPTHRAPRPGAAQGSANRALAFPKVAVALATLALLAMATMVVGILALYKHS